MTSYYLKNQYITARVNRFGAELTSLVANETGQEYLWQADPAYWRRTSPVLFPVVGRLKNNSYRYQAKTYSMPQHGFARDKDFTLIEQTERKLSFMLSDDVETRTIYPFSFRLIIGYELEEKSISVRWRIVNTGNQIMYFSIGSHPAFLCPLNKDEKQSDCFLSFDAEGPLFYHHIGQESLYQSQEYRMELKNGMLPLKNGMFDSDVFIFENYQIKAIALLHKDQQPYLTLKFHAPVVGIWSPPKKQAPFLCIEPWFGRCDEEEYAGSIEARAYGNKLAGGAEFRAGYTIEIV